MLRGSVCRMHRDFRTGPRTVMTARRPIGTVPRMSRRFRTRSRSDWASAGPWLVACHPYPIRQSCRRVVLLRRSIRPSRGGPTVLHVQPARGAASWMGSGASCRSRRSRSSSGPPSCRPARRGRSGDRPRPPHPRSRHRTQRREHQPPDRCSRPGRLPPPMGVGVRRADQGHTRHRDAVVRRPSRMASFRDRRGRDAGHRRRPRCFSRHNCGATTSRGSAARPDSSIWLIWWRLPLAALVVVWGARTTTAGH